MENNNKKLIWIIIAVVVVALIGFFVYSRSNQAGIKSFSVANSQFVVSAHGLSKVEIWGVPTGTNLSTSDNMLLTIVEAKAGTTGTQELTAHIPQMELSLTEIFAVGFDKNGKNVGRVSLPQKGATALHDALWGKK